MITLDDLRGYATALPDVEEKPHFRLPAWQVKGKMFTHIQHQETHAIVCVSQADAKAAVAEDSTAYEEVWRNHGQIFVGLRVDLAKVPQERFRELVERAWRNKAPKRLVTTYDNDS